MIPSFYIWALSDKQDSSSSSVEHLRRPRTTVEGSLKNSCRQNDVVLRGVVVRVHSRRGHAPSTKIKATKLLRTTVNPQLFLRITSASGRQRCCQVGGKSKHRLISSEEHLWMCAELSQDGSVPGRAGASSLSTQAALTGFCREVSSAGPQSLGPRSCSTAWRSGSTGPTPAQTGRAEGVSSEERRDGGASESATTFTYIIENLVEVSGVHDEVWISHHVVDRIRLPAQERGCVTSALTPDGAVSPPHNQSKAGAKMISLSLWRLVWFLSPSSWHVWGCPQMPIWLWSPCLQPEGCRGRQLLIMHARAPTSGTAGAYTHNGLAVLGKGVFDKHGSHGEA